MKKRIFYLSIVLFTTTMFAQKSVNNYKYVIVPNRFEFQTKTNQYQLNSLTKFLFNKAGFNTFLLSDIMPKEIITNNCSTLTGNVVDESNMFTTKLKIQLVDCYDKTIFETQVVKSKEKDFKTAFYKAIRNAFEEINNLNYSYQPIEKDKPKNTIEEKIVAQSESVKVKKEVIEKEMKKKNADKKEIVVVRAIPNLKKDINTVAKVKKTEIFLKPHNTLVGNYIFERWGLSTISKKENSFSVVGGDENFEFATIYKTSKPTVFIIKWVAFKQPQLLEIDSNGNLKIDSEKGVKTIKREN
ncbi:hypothetical protein Lupro_05165 [Lutibacter profundi]|uniref:Uncharacterized protein n=1 Tax=Lutibacter profundi TaxID=1622118 RepID=A0A0X8G617_9FLAO|nr:hypothetical protein [Lutibacter profundi]AMC10668.1 hypothetical protein Lupro_05165 [Lutibacter profundi]